MPDTCPRVDWTCQRSLWNLTHSSLDSSGTFLLPVSGSLYRVPHGFNQSGSCDIYVVLGWIEPRAPSRATRYRHVIDSSLDYHDYHGYSFLIHRLPLQQASVSFAGRQISSAGSWARYPSPCDGYNEGLVCREGVLVRLPRIISFTLLMAAFRLCV